MKTRILTAALLLSSTLLVAQTKSLSLDAIAQHVGNGVSKNYKPDSASLSKTCRRGFLLIRFNVDQQGKIANLALSKDSTTFITTALKEAVYSLQNDISLINTLKTSGRTVIQPFLYFYQAGCYFPRADAVPATVTEKESAEFSRAYLRTLMEMDHIDDAVSDILTFDNGSAHAVDAILLNPIMVSSGSME